MSNTVNIDRPSEVCTLLQPGSDLDSPQDLLEKLDGLVGSNGCIKSTQEIPKIVNMMKEVTSLINKCLLLNVLQTTKANATLTRLMEDGGWSILNVWLLDAKKTGNTPLLIEIMQVLNKLPVTIAALKQGNMGKIVKQLTRHNSTEVKKVASELLDKWMAIFREGQAARSAKDSVSSEGQSSSEVASTEESKPKKSKKSKKEKELKSPVELQPPLGPLVALGKPRDKLKRPRDLVLGKNAGTSEKKPKTVSPSMSAVDDDENEKTDKSQKGITESLSFMNALSSQAAKWHEKRVKKIKAADRAKAHSKTTTSGDLGDNEKLPSTDTTAMSVDTPTEEQPMETSSALLSQDTSNDQQAMETAPVATTSLVKPKKKVTWAADNVLTSIQYFEIDESERVNRTRSFLDAAQKEKLMEREAMSSGRMFDQLMEMMQWYRPRKYADVISLVERGQMSEQRTLQSEREQKVLGQLFLSKASVAPTPVEPDPELEKNELKPKLIPLLEPGAVDQPNIYQPTPSGGPPGPGLIHPPPPHPPSHVMGGPPPPPHHIMDPKMMAPAHRMNMYPNQEPMVPHPLSNGPPNIRPEGPPPAPPMMMGGDQVGGDWYGYNPPPGGGGRGYLPNYGGGNGEPFRGGGGPHGRGGRGGRGRGRGQYQRFRNENGNHSNICKHFITHGCRLGNACKFLHVTPEELSNNIHPSHKD